MNRLDYTFMQRINAKTDPEWALMKRSASEDEPTKRERIVYGIVLVACFLVVGFLDGRF